MLKYLLTLSIICSSVFAETPLFKHKGLEYQELTEHGLTELKAARDALRQRDRLFELEFKGLGNIHHAATVARMLKSNMFLYGPPGGAKSAFVNWLFSGEAEATFKLQMHQMMGEQALIGGQDFEAAKQGKYILNTATSLANFRVGLLDEIEKGNPAVLATLLSLLNEREVMAGGETIKVKTESVFATSNAILPEIFQQFLESGQRTTAPALLNRFQFKGFVYNWLDPNSQAELDARRDKKLRCEALNACNETTHEKPDIVNWENLRRFSRVLFVKTPEFLTAYNELANDLRKCTNEAVRDSELKHQKDRYNEPFVYFPSCDWTERLRGQIPESVQMSAMVDFLLSPWANNEDLEKMTQKQINLGPTSLWRIYLIATTPSMGKASLFKNDDGKLELQFGTKLSAESARDARESKMLQNIAAEQERFKAAYLKRITDIQKISANLAPFTSSLAESKDFELLVMPSKE